MSAPAASTRPLPAAIERKVQHLVRHLVSKVDTEQPYREEVASMAADLLRTSRTSWGAVYDRAWVLADEAGR